MNPFLAPQPEPVAGPSVHLDALIHLDLIPGPVRAVSYGAMNMGAL